MNKLDVLSKINPQMKAVLAKEDELAGDANDTSVGFEKMRENYVAGRAFWCEGGPVMAEKLDAEVGAEVELPVICVVDGETVEADPAKAAATKVVATVIEQFKGEKVLVFKFKKRKNYKKLRGHRQQLTRVEIKSVGTAVAE